MSLKTGSHAVHYHSVQWTLDLWRAMSRMISELQRPLPAGCHLIPEIVATWNREAKGSIDVYCCFQKNCKAVYAHLCPVGAIWLRLIMTCVYNAYHAYGLSQSVEYLLNQEECKSFSGFHKHRSRQLSFKQFCQELANDLNIEVVAPSMYASSSSSSSSNDESRVMSEEDSLECNPYNKREAFFNKVPLIEQRMNRSAHHKRVAMQKQMSYIWCCRVDHSTARTKHYRHQRKTTVACPICGVTLLRTTKIQWRELLQYVPYGRDTIRPMLRGDTMLGSDGPRWWQGKYSTVASYATGDIRRQPTCSMITFYHWHGCW